MMDGEISAGAGAEVGAGRAELEMGKEEDDCGIDIADVEVELDEWRLADSLAQGRTRPAGASIDMGGFILISPNACQGAEEIRR
ncbi:hypothetical protein KCU81_g685, partial [Aureobasidium melanogenum]